MLIGIKGSSMYDADGLDIFILFYQVLSRFMIWFLGIKNIKLNKNKTLTIEI